VGGGEGGVVRWDNMNIVVNEHMRIVKHTELIVYPFWKLEQSKIEACV